MKAINVFLRQITSKKEEKVAKVAGTSSSHLRDVSGSFPRCDLGRLSVYLFNNYTNSL